MGTIADINDLVDKLTGGNNGNPETVLTKKFLTSGGAAIGATTATGLHSGWLMDGDAQGSHPGSATVCNSSTTGALPFTAPGGGRTKMVAGLSMISGGSNAAYPLGLDGVLLYDRLLHMGGFDPTVATAQTVGGALARNTGGEGNRIYWETSAALVGTARTITCSYTNQAGTSGRTTRIAEVGSTNGNSHLATGCIMLPLQQGDTGVRSIESVTFGASLVTGTGGVVIGKPLMFVSAQMPTRAATPPDEALGIRGIVPIDDTACLAFLFSRQQPSEGSAVLLTTFVEA